MEEIENHHCLYQSNNGFRKKKTMNEKSSGWKYHVEQDTLFQNILLKIVNIYKVENINLTLDNLRALANLGTVTEV